MGACESGCCFFDSACIVELLVVICASWHCFFWFDFDFYDLELICCGKWSPNQTPKLGRLGGSQMGRTEVGWRVTEQLLGPTIDSSLLARRSENISFNKTLHS